MHRATTKSIDEYTGIFYQLLNTKVFLYEHCHDSCCEIMVVLRGQLDHKSDGITTTMKTGDLFYLPENSVHLLSRPSSDLILLNLLVLPSVLDMAADFLKNGSLPQHTEMFHIDLSTVDYLLKSHDRLTVLSSMTEQAAIIRTMLILLLTHCNDGQISPGRKKADWFSVLLAQMKRQENFRLGVQRMQELAYCTPSHLSRACKKHTGMTPTQYIDSLRIHYACSLLRHTELSIFDICMECGYNSLNYFYRCFSRTTGMSPGRYKELHCMKLESMPTEHQPNGQVSAF